MRPNTSESGIFSTNRNSPVSTSMLTRMLVPKPKKAFQSPGVHRTGLKSDLTAVPVLVLIVMLLLLEHDPEKWNPVFRKDHARIKDAFEVSGVIAFRTAAESETQPKMPPWALIIFRPMSWNSGK